MGENGRVPFETEGDLGRGSNVLTMATAKDTTIQFEKSSLTADAHEVGQHLVGPEIPSLAACHSEDLQGRELADQEITAQVGTHGVSGVVDSTLGHRIKRDIQAELSNQMHPISKLVSMNGGDSPGKWLEAESEIRTSSPDVDRDNAKIAENELPSLDISASLNERNKFTTGFGLSATQGEMIAGDTGITSFGAPNASRPGAQSATVDSYRIAPGDLLQHCTLSNPDRRNQHDTLAQQSIEPSAIQEMVGARNQHLNWVQKPNLTMSAADPFLPILYGRGGIVQYMPIAGNNAPVSSGNTRMYGPPDHGRSPISNFRNTQQVGAGAGGLLNGGITNSNEFVDNFTSGQIGPSSNEALFSSRQTDACTENLNGYRLNMDPGHVIDGAQIHQRQATQQGMFIPQVPIDGVAPATTTACSACGMLFGDATSLRAHITMNHLHLLQRPAKQCSVCKTIFKSEQNAQRHMQTAHTEWNKICRFCNVGFKNGSSLNFHIRSTHMESSPSGQVVLDGNNTKAPVVSGTNSNSDGALRSLDYTCRVCSRTFGWKGNLQRHINLCHKRVRPFSCGICKKTFGTKSNMNVHLFKCLRTAAQP